MIKRIILLSIILGGCTPPDPPAYACSPRLDGGPTYCPPVSCQANGCLEPKPTPPEPKPTPPTLPREELRGEIDVYDPNHWQQMQHFWLRNARRNEIEKNMTQPEDAINNALLEFNYGSNDTTKSQELLQLQSDGD